MSGRGRGKPGLEGLKNRRNCLYANGLGGSGPGRAPGNSLGRKRLAGSHCGLFPSAATGPGGRSPDGDPAVAGRSEGCRSSRAAAAMDYVCGPP